uniref:BACK domain-containing protein n=1 Tax=Chromera velia CCMP2878 TaxID=1169474 RepID=A0A0G4GZ40_9ALVE|eukprot:Cvel_24005.t1-p1 / transcript=Cvel_24005.t1 / gene=Cvel_24005 / organism=Chromera_velia_CCMP2878 / gene_product=hypothetical protein / transcript_product=hypothetical protein / location=Cvel_scaffold2545:20315-22348(-) / protein_length=264 / sequence_SO=supercontig / SO=protein_coding / is_pseudo=false
MILVRFDFEIGTTDVTLLAAVLVESNRLGLLKLRQLCLIALGRPLALSDYCEFVSLAAEIRLPGVGEECARMLADISDFLFEDTRYLRLGAEGFSNFIASPNLMRREVEIFCAVELWLSQMWREEGGDEEFKRATEKELMRSVRFERMSLPELRSIRRQSAVEFLLEGTLLKLQRHEDIEMGKEPKPLRVRQWTANQNFAVDCEGTTFPVVLSKKSMSALEGKYQSQKFHANVRGSFVPPHRYAENRNGRWNQERETMTLPGYE